VQHEQGQGLDLINLYLERSDTGQVVQDSGVVSRNEYRFLAMRRTQNWVSAPLRLVLDGVDVTGDDSGCGNNSMLVYYALFWEDSDREGAENLGSFATPSSTCGNQDGCIERE
jgi:hypothetical protein